MKKKVFVSAAIAAAFVLIGLAVWLLFFRPLVIPFTGSGETEYDGNITMSALFPVYDKSCEYMTVVISNDSGETAEFGNAWYLEKYVLGSWMDVPRQGDYVVESILRILQPGGKYAFDCWLTSFVGDLDDGKYRIVKEINDEIYSAEFEIGESEITLESPFGYMPTAPLGYDKEQADADGACGLTDGAVEHEEKLLEFLRASQIPGLQAQIRLYTMTDDGKLYFTDIVKLKHPVYRVTTWEQTAADAVRMKIYSSSDSNASEKYAPELLELIDVRYYDSLVTDGEAVWLSAYSDLRDIEPDKNDLCIIPKEYVSDDVKSWIENEFVMQTEELQYSVWNKDGTRCTHTRVNSADEDYKRRYFVSIYNERGYSTRGYTCGIKNGIFEMNKDGGIREFVWVDDITVMMCAEDGKGNNYYEFYDTEAEERLSYTMSQYEYKIKDGEIIIPE